VGDQVTAVPDAKITIFPDASYGSTFQCAAEAARQALAFLA
jgi:hypothetical protein